MDKIKVLHFFGKMDRGGAETFIMNVYRNIDREKITFDFIVVSSEKGSYDDEIRKLGGDIHILPSPKDGLKNYKNTLKKLLLRGKYDIVHSHVHYFSGVNLSVAEKSGVKKRIAHSHTNNPNKPFSLKRILYENYMKYLIDKNANYLLACSNEAAGELYLKKDSRVKVINNGIEIERFIEKRFSKEEYRKLIDLPERAFILGHVGGFRPEKNHYKLVDIFNNIHKNNQNAHLVLVGDGKLKKEIENRVKELNIQENVHFLGVRDDIPQILKTFDVFVFPSLYEGLGIAVIEAQVSGLYCVVSDTLPKEVDITGNVDFVSLDKDSSEWSKKILSIKYDYIKDIKRFKNYDIKTVCSIMTDIYNG